MSGPLVAIEDLCVHFRVGGGGPLPRRRTLRAVDGVSLELRAGERLGLVGESGSGKSTLGRALLGLVAASGGRVLVDGLDVTSGAPDALARLRRLTAMVFQDPYGSLDPMQRVGDALDEVLRRHRRGDRRERAARVDALLERVGLSPELARRRPHALSGGQCQRVGIARALAVEPRLIVADECVAALDVSIQGQIVNLLRSLSESDGVTLLFIAHDLALVRRLCERVAVLYLGRIVEEGPTEAVFEDPRHPYTRALVDAIPHADPDRPSPARTALEGEPPSPLAPPPGCPFHPRCPHALERCRSDPAPGLERDGARRWRCVLPAGALRGGASRDAGAARTPPPAGPPASPPSRPSTSPAPTGNHRR